jgi:uncharacterized protein (TIGR03435 family)
MKRRRVKKIGLLAFLLTSRLLNPILCGAQAVAESTIVISPTFEVASIRLEESGGTSHYVKIGFERNGFEARGASLLLLLQEAYGINDDRQIVGGPSWVGSQSFTIEAKIDDATVDALDKLSDDRLNLAQKRMLQTLLADRFNLTLHRETKELPIYSLVTTKNVPKLHQSKPGDDYANGTQWPGGASMGPDTVSYLFLYGNVQMKGQGASMDRLVDRLTQNADRLQLDRKIVDNTGLTGKYDFVLNFRVPSRTNVMGEVQTDDPALKKEIGEIEAANSGSNEMSIFTALQEQLGLKLESKRGPVETLVVDHVELPSPN